MEVVIHSSLAELAVATADRFEGAADGRLQRIGLATGSSPLPLYDELIARHRRTGYLAAVEFFQLDEYVGLGGDDPNSYRQFLLEHVLGPLGLPAERLHAIDGAAADPFDEADRYEAELVAAGGVELQVLGLGSDGHIGFNEPGSSLGSLTRVKTLTATTRSDNARFFAAPEDVPHHVITQGVGTILRAGEIIVIATGAGKADAVAATVEGPLTSSVPGSALQLHPRVQIHLDEPAAANLARADYYRETLLARPRLPDPPR